MSISQQALEQLDSHWAVVALGPDQRQRGEEVAERLLVASAVGHQIELHNENAAADIDLIRRVAVAYELASIETLPTLVNVSPQVDSQRDLCIAGAWRTFEFRRLLPIPENVEERIFHVLHLSALAYCGDRWSDVRRWYKEHQEAIVDASVADEPWHRRVLFRLFECWIRLFRKRDWDDLDHIREIVAGLREDQAEYEASSLDSGSNARDRAMAVRLIILYNWAKATELLARYVLQGEPRSINALLDKHFEAAEDASVLAADAQLEVLMRWLHATARQMVASSLWWVAHAINSRVTRFVASATKHQGMFELLPPQRAALQEQGLLDAAATAVVIDLPTSGGKTLLAQFRILQALNQFSQNGGWVAYVVPTKALGAQITRRLRRDFGPIGILVEELTGAVEVDAIEEEMLGSVASGEDRQFDILVATPEKLQLVIRNKKVERPLVLVVMDEAHNIESEQRGMRIEFLLATVKQECLSASFLLLLPFVERPDLLARWLAEDVARGRSISLGTSPWKPNEQLVGMFHAEADDSVSAGWRLKFQTLVTTRKTIHLKGVHNVGGVKPLNLVKSKVISKGRDKSATIQAAAMAAVFSTRGTSIAVGDTVPHTWSMARTVHENLPELENLPSRIRLVQDFLASEVSPEFELIRMLSRGVAVHHAGISDEARALIEWLAEEGDIRVLCATTTIAQGINFPVSSVFLATNKYPYGKEMSPREFWNFAGRAGRMNQDSVGVIGIAQNNRPNEIAEYLKDATGELASRLVTVVAALDSATNDDELVKVLQDEQWEDFRCYVNHLVHEHKTLDAFLANADLSLRNTYGYLRLTESPKERGRAQKLLDATKAYGKLIAKNRGRVEMADKTGFSFEGVGRALSGINELQRDLTPSDFAAEHLFGNAGGMTDIYGIMLKVPQLARNLEEIAGSGLSHKKLGDITQDWVAGKTIEAIAQSHFGKDRTATEAITEACRAIYRNLVNNGTWGLSAVSRLSGIDFEKLSDEQKRHVNLLPAMIYHGVKTEEGVLMRMNGVPRSIAEQMGLAYRQSERSGERSNVRKVRDFLASADIGIWNRACPKTARLSGSRYREVWQVISGEGR